MGIIICRMIVVIVGIIAIHSIALDLIQSNKEVELMKIQKGGTDGSEHEGSTL